MSFFYMEKSNENFFLFAIFRNKNFLFRIHSFFNCYFFVLITSVHWESVQIDNCLITWKSLNMSQYFLCQNTTQLKKKEDFFCHNFLSTFPFVKDFFLIKIIFSPEKEKHNDCTELDDSRAVGVNDVL
jgi:hypothetical protein